MGENFPSLAKEINRIQEAEQTPNRINGKKCKPKHTSSVVRLPKMKHRKILESRGRNNALSVRGKQVK